MRSIFLSLALSMFVLISCFGGSKIVGKWALADQNQSCWPIRGFTKIEFLNDQTVIYYDVLGGNESSAGITADYSLSDDNRITINVRSSITAGTDIFNYQISGNTLKLCDGNDCCDLVRE